MENQLITLIMLDVGFLIGYIAASIQNALKQQSTDKKEEEKKNE